MVPISLNSQRICQCVNRKLQINSYLEIFNFWIVHIGYMVKQYNTKYLHWLALYLEKSMRITQINIYFREMVIGNNS